MSATSDPRRAARAAENLRRRLAAASLKSLIEHLDQALASAADLDRALDRDFEIDIVLDTDHARNLVRAREHAKDLAVVLNDAVFLDRDISATCVAGEVTFGFADRGPLIRDTSLAKARRLLGRGRDIDRVLDGVRVRDRELLLAREAVRKLIARVGERRRRVAELRAKLMAEPEIIDQGRMGREMARSAVRVAAWAVRFLPPGARARYDEEFQAELYDLAAAGAARRHQLWYAVRLLAGVPKLRGALKLSASRRAVS